MGGDSLVERTWKLGEDLFTSDNLLDPITFDDLILALHCNCKDINGTTALKQLDEIVQDRLFDMWELFARNRDEIVRLAKVGRAGYEN